MNTDAICIVVQKQKVHSAQTKYKEQTNHRYYKGFLYQSEMVLFVFSFFPLFQPWLKQISSHIDDY